MHCMAACCSLCQLFTNRLYQANEATLFTRRLADKAEWAKPRSFNDRLMIMLLGKVCSLCRTRRRQRAKANLLYIILHQSRPYIGGWRWSTWLEWFSVKSDLHIYRITFSGSTTTSIVYTQVHGHQAKCNRPISDCRISLTCINIAVSNLIFWMDSSITLPWRAIFKCDLLCNITSCLLKLKTR